MSQASSPRSAGQMIGDYFRDFSVLRETRAEFWGIQIVNLLDCTFYFAMLTIASLFLSQDLGMSDTRAGFVIAAFTSATTILLTVSGMLSDWIGIRKSLRLSMWAMLGLRSVVVTITVMPGIPHKGLIVALLLVLMAPFMAAIQTIFQAATQRYTTTNSRSAGFNLWYLFMNIGAFIGGGSVDVVRLLLKVNNVHIFTMGIGTAVLCLVVAECMVRSEAQLTGESEKTNAPTEKPKNERPLRILLNVSRESAFFRLVVLIALILGVRAVYAYLYLLMPKYWERTIGADAAIGSLNMINPIGIVLGLVLFIPLANKFKVYNMLVYGAMVSAFSLFPMALPWNWYGCGIVSAHYIMAILCMVIVTIGEVLWSPKLNEYTAAIAPKGQEGTYLGLSMIPWFLAKTLVSALSGPMLTRWAPAKVTIGTQEMSLQNAMKSGLLDYWSTPAAMWLILGGFAFVGCLGALALRGWLTKTPEKPWIAPDDHISEKEAAAVFLVPATWAIVWIPLWKTFWGVVAPQIAFLNNLGAAERVLAFCGVPIGCAFLSIVAWGSLRWTRGRRSGVQLIVLGVIAGILWYALAGFIWIIWQIAVAS